MSGNNGLDWAGLMQAGLGELRLTPDQFWSLTPVELAMMLGRRIGAASMSRARLDALMAAYPDQPASQPSDTEKGNGHERA